VDYLASELNVDPPKREVFHNFCRALNVGNRLVQASARSGNPTGYLLQKCSDERLENVERALTEIGKGHVFQQLLARMREGGGL
jgi:methylase of polypeptide subunit release factors